MKKLFLILLILFVIPIVSAHETDFEHKEDLPLNLQRVVEYNKQQADFYFRNLSFIIAFLAGILTILTPCSLAILPAFFAYTFREKNKITKMTLTFFLGFAPVFVIFGLLAAFLGKSIAMLQQNSRIFIIIAGFIIIGLGLMALFVKRFVLVVFCQFH